MEVLLLVSSRWCFWFQHTVLSLLPQAFPRWMFHQVRCEADIPLPALTKRLVQVVVLNAA